jgi:HEAT repeat protein
MTTPKKEKAAQGSREVLSKIESSIAGLRSRDGMVRQKARRRLTIIGKRAVPHLIALLKDPKDDVRWEAAKALASIADTRATPGLVAALEDRTFGVRWLAAEGLIAMGRDALVPLLETLIERSNSVWLRGGAHHVLHDLARADLQELLTPVVAALDGVDPEIGIRRPATKALRELRG